MAAIHETMNDLPESVRAEVIELLNDRLADSVDLQTQCKQAHWNVRGPQFIALHKLFDESYQAVEEYVDLLADFGKRMRRAIEKTEGLHPLAS